MVSAYIRSTNSNVVLTLAHRKTDRSFQHQGPHGIQEPETRSHGYLASYGDAQHACG
jgi:hypothetical protein